MVVFVIALPLLLLFLFAVIDLGRTVFLSMALNDAAHAVCRTVSEQAGQSASESQMRQAAFEASPALDRDGLRLRIAVQYGELEDRAYAHRFYDEAAGRYDERVSHTSTRAVEVSVELEGAYLTPLGDALSGAAGEGAGRFVYRAQASGVADATVEGGSW